MTDILLDNDIILWLDDMLEPPITENVFWCKLEWPVVQMIENGVPIKYIDMADNFVPLIEWIVQNGLAECFIYNIHSCNIDKTKEKQIVELLKPYNVKLTFNPPSKILKHGESDTLFRLEDY